jgi:hypothetical protein
LLLLLGQSFQQFGEEGIGRDRFEPGPPLGLWLTTDPAATAQKRPYAARTAASLTFPGRPVGSGDGLTSVVAVVGVVIGACGSVGGPEQAVTPAVATVKAMLRWVRALRCCGLGSACAASALMASGVY